MRREARVFLGLRRPFELGSAFLGREDSDPLWLVRFMRFLLVFKGRRRIKHQPDMLELVNVVMGVPVM